MEKYSADQIRNEIIELSLKLQDEDNWFLLKKIENIKIMFETFCKDIYEKRITGRKK
jgi:LPS sulfotransferase NodH